MFLDPDALQEVGYDYGNAAMDTMVLFAVKTLEERDLPIQLENVTTAVFCLFPKRFHLRGYPAWPDSLLAYRALERCRTDKHWLTGTMKARFQLTEAGRAMASSLQPADFARPRKKAETRNADAFSTALVEEFRASRAFRGWVRTGRIEEHLVEYLLALHCTSSSHCRIQRGRYDDLQAAAQAVGDEQVLACLLDMQRQFPDPFGG
jgi:hypothetical protein